MSVTFPILEALYFVLPSRGRVMYLILPTKQADAPFSGAVPRSGYLGAILLYCFNGYIRGLITVYDYLQFALHTKDDNDSQER